MIAARNEGALWSLDLRTAAISRSSDRPASEGSNAIATAREREEESLMFMNSAEDLLSPAEFHLRLFDVSQLN